VQGEARREWHRIGIELVRLGLVARIDKAALAIYCQLWQRWIDAENAVRELGLIVTNAQLRAYVSQKLLTEKGAEGIANVAAKKETEAGFLFPGLAAEEEDKSYPGKNPFLSIAESCMDRMKAFLVEFGMTPSSRARVKSTPAETTDEIEAALQAGSQDETEPSHLQ
jgi:P27 family predicted phage terminase small subunit